MSYRDRIKDLESEIGDLQNNINNNNGEMSLSTLLCLIVPVIVFIVLYYFSPFFVQSDDNGQSVRSIKKVALYTLLITGGIWGGLYGYKMYSQ